MTVFGRFQKIQQGCKWYTPYQGILCLPNDTRKYSFLLDDFHETHRSSTS